MYLIYICSVKRIVPCSVERQVCGGWVRQRLRILAQHGIQSGESQLNRSLKMFEAVFLAGVI